MSTSRNTKILATLGPASSDLDTIRALHAAGADVFRLNFSHGSHEDHAARAELLFRAGHRADSRRAYDRAIATAPSASDAAFLTKRRARLGE